MTSVVAQEIAAQPAAVAAFLDRQLAPARRAVAALPPFAHVIVAARGSSDHAALFAEHIWGILAHLPVGGATPSLHTLYKTPPRFDQALVVAISQSGQSPDVVAVAEEARRQGRPAIAITNDASSPLARVADHVIDLGTVEHSIAATKTYTCQLAAVALLGALWARDEARVDELRRMPEAMAKTLALAAEPAGRAAAAFQDVDTMLILARGINLCTAHEIALKLREILQIATHPFSAADFRHGSIALLEQGLPAALVMPSGAAYEDMAALARELEAGGARLLVLSDEARASSSGRAVLPVTQVPEWSSPLVTVLPAQVLAVELARARGVDPDHPRGLTAKVVRTV